MSEIADFITHPAKLSHISAQTLINILAVVNGGEICVINQRPADLLQPSDLRARSA